MVNPDMCTNQSRHTVSFSDLAWPSTAPTFPKAWQVGQYLQRYIATYPGYEIRTGYQVVKTELLNEKWRVHVQDRKGVAEPEISEYDQVIVSSGFFGKPKIPQPLEGFKAPAIHSSQLRSPKNLTATYGRGLTDRGRNIVVVGGQMSGIDVAASLALQLSSDANTPENSDEKPHDQFTITHIIQRPFWIMPLFFPTNPQIDKSLDDKVIDKSLDDKVRDFQ
jgi:cation diffusion facilitator CzcD-associated flavoprotein CzcO